MRISKRQLLKCALCALVFGATVAFALHLSRPQEFSPRIRHYGASRATRVQVETQDDLLKVRVGKEKYEYQLIQTETGYAAAEVPKDPKERKARLSRPPRRVSPP